MKSISMKDGREVIVDDDVYKWAKDMSWHTDEKGYVRHMCNKEEKAFFGKKFVYLHILVVDCPVGMVRDHVDGNKLDCRREKVRICTNQQNLWNSKTNRKNNKSGYKGVSWDSHAEMWKACIRVDGKRISLRYWRNPEDAARAYDDAARTYFGKYAKTNFK